MGLVAKDLEQTFLSLGIPLADYGLADKSGIIFKSSFRNPKIFSNSKKKKNNIFRMASMSKIITAFLTLSILEEKNISVHETVVKYLPELKNVKLANLKDKVVQLSKINNNITFHQLLNCTSGHGYEHHHEPISQLVKKKYLSPMKIGDDQFLKAPLISLPGKSWNYGVSYGWLGKAIEAITNESLNGNLKKYVTQPLGLKNTTFDFNEVDASKVVPVFFKDSTNQFVDISDKINIGKGDFHYGGGGLLSSLEDYLKFLTLFLNEGPVHSRCPKKEKIIDKILTNQIGKLVVKPLKSFNKTLVLDYNLYPKIKKKWGYGLLLNIDPLKERRSQGSGSWAGVLNTYFWIDKRKGTVGAILMQSLPCYDENALKAFEEFEKIMYKQVFNKK